MKVLGASKFGRQNLSFFSHHPKPSCSQSHTDVVIKVDYSDLNPVDHHKLNSKPNGAAIPLNRTPFIVGFGGSGIVESVSEAADDQTRMLLNKRVVFIANPTKDGSYAQYVKCDSRAVAVLPDSISSSVGASIPIAGCTAFESLEKVGLPINTNALTHGLEGKGKTLLIVGAAGGVGSWIIQLARAKYPKLNVVCTVGSEESSRWCQKMNCSKTIKHNEIDTLGGGPKGSCNYIICLTEPTAELFASLSEVLRPYGSICLVVAGEGIKCLDLSFIFFKCGTVSTETVFSSIRNDFYCLDQAREMSIILQLIKDGSVSAPISSIWNEADSDWNKCNEKGGYIDLVGSGHVKGKLVMKIGK